MGYLAATCILLGDFSKLPEKELINLVLPDASACFKYALHGIGGPFPLGEPAISTSSTPSLGYAQFVLHGPFPLGEPAIAENPSNSIDYVKNVLHKPFPLGEPGIRKSEYLDQYNKILKKYGYSPIKEE